MDRRTNMGCVGQNVVSAQEWAYELFGEDAEALRAKAEQIIEDNGVSLHIEMILPMDSAREWLEAYENSLHGIPDAMASMLVFLESIAKQIQDGIEMDIDDELHGYLDDDE